jgi:hypothetical protein
MMGVASHRIRQVNWITTLALVLFHVGALAAFFVFTWQALWRCTALGSSTRRRILGVAAASPPATIRPTTGGSHY